MLGMSLRTVLTQRMELKQVLTPQQRQLVDLLEVPDASLDTYLADMVTVNPALRRVNLGYQRGGETERGRVRAPDPEERDPLARLTEGPDFARALLDQFRLEHMTDGERAAGMMILGNLDERGFLGMELEEVARIAQVHPDDAEGAQMILMELDPLGVGADDLQHYLRFMAKRKWPEDPNFRELIDEHLHLLQHGKFRKVARATGLEVEDVQEYWEMIRSLPPYPAYGSGGSVEAFVQPSMEVFYDEEAEEWDVRMFEDHRRNYELDRSFLQRLETCDDPDERKRMRKQIEEAKVLMANLEQRHSLVKQIAQFAVRHQADFFAKGPEHIRNLTMTNVGKMLSRDTSTVSRAVMGRYFRFEGGVLPLRDLFVNRGSDEDVSEAALHLALQQLIDGEDKRKPLSDDALSKLLKKQGIQASRRTVAKHRDRMGVPSSRDRRVRN